MVVEIPLPVVYGPCASVAGQFYSSTEPPSCSCTYVAVRAFSSCDAAEQRYARIPPLNTKAADDNGRGAEALETREQCSPPVDYCDIIGLDAHRPQSRRKAVNYRTVTTRNWLTEAHWNDHSIVLQVNDYTSPGSWDHHSSSRSFLNHNVDGTCSTETSYGAFPDIKQATTITGHLLLPFSRNTHFVDTCTIHKYHASKPQNTYTLQQ